MTSPSKPRHRLAPLPILRGVMRCMSERNLDLIAAGVAFYAMLAVFPAFAAVIAFWGFISDPSIIEDQLNMLRGLVPAEAFALLDGQVQALVAANSSTLGWATIVSIGGALWSTRAGVGALVRGLTAVYGTQPREGYWHSLAAILMTFALIGLALTALVAVIVIPIVLVFLPLGPLTNMALTGARWFLLIGVGLTGLWLVYRFAPNHAVPRSRWASPGALVALILWAAASWGFSFYLGNFGNYNQIYGSIGAVIVLLMWLFISAYAVLIGAALNAEINKALQVTVSDDGPQNDLVDQSAQ